MLHDNEANLSNVFSHLGPELLLLFLNMHNGKQTVDGNTGKTQGDNGERTWIVILIVMAMRWPPFPSLNFQPQKKSLCVYLSAIWRRSRREFEHSNVPEAKKVLSIRNGGPCVRKTRQAC